MSEDPTYKYVKGVGWIPDVAPKVRPGFSFEHLHLLELTRETFDRTRIHEEDWGDRVELSCRIQAGPQAGNTLHMTVTYRYWDWMFENELGFARRAMQREVERLERDVF